MNQLVRNNKGNISNYLRILQRQSKTLEIPNNVNSFNHSNNITQTNQPITITHFMSSYKRYTQLFQARSLSQYYCPSYNFVMKNQESQFEDDQKLSASLSDSHYRDTLISSYHSNSSDTNHSSHEINQNSSNNRNNMNQNNIIQKDSANTQTQCSKDKLTNIESLIKKTTNNININHLKQEPGNSQQQNSSQGLNNNQQKENLENQQQQDQQQPQGQPQQQQNAQELKIASKQFKFNDFCELTKFRLSFMNTLVALPTYLYLAENVSAQLIPLGLATQLMAMSSQIANQIKEQDLDKQMVRTQRRPLPSGLITSRQAQILMFLTYCSSNAILLSCFPLQTALVANAIFFGYISIYTPMKRYSTFNTFVGAIVGSLTPYIGYTAAGGAITDLYPLYYSLYMVFWQFQHFYGISWIYQNDYKRAGYQMSTNKNEALFYMLTSFSVNAAANYALFFTNPVYPYLSFTYSAVMAVSYALTFAIPTYKFYNNPSQQNAKSLKSASYIHLAAFFAIIIIDMCLRIYENKCKKGLEQQSETNNTQHTKKLDEQSMIGKVHKFLFEKQSNQSQINSNSSIQQQQQSVTQVSSINNVSQSQTQTTQPKSS